MELFREELARLVSEPHGAKSEHEMQSDIDRRGAGVPVAREGHGFTAARGVRGESAEDADDGEEARVRRKDISCFGDGIECADRKAADYIDDERGKGKARILNDLVERE